MALKNYIIYDEFKIKAFLVIPKNTLSAILQFFNNLACIVPILSNYICFFFIIKDSYKKPTQLEENLVSNDDLITIPHNEHRNNDIEEYLS